MFPHPADCARRFFRLGRRSCPWLRPRAQWAYAPRAEIAAASSAAKSGPRANFRGRVEARIQGARLLKHPARDVRVIGSLMNEPTPAKIRNNVVHEKSNKVFGVR